MPQWDASLRFDQRAALPGVKVPVHVIAFAEDVEAPPQAGLTLSPSSPNSLPLISCVPSSFPAGHWPAELLLRSALR